MNKYNNENELDLTKDTTFYIVIYENDLPQVYKTFDQALFASKCQPTKEIREFIYAKKYKVKLIYEEEK